MHTTTLFQFAIKKLVFKLKFWDHAGTAKLIINYCGFLNTSTVSVQTVAFVSKRLYVNYVKLLKLKCSHIKKCFCCAFIRL